MLLRNCASCVQVDELLGDRKPGVEDLRALKVSGRYSYLLRANMGRWRRS